MHFDNALKKNTQVNVGPCTCYLSLGHCFFAKKIKGLDEMILKVFSRLNIL